MSNITAKKLDFRLILHACCHYRLRKSRRAICEALAGPGLPQNFMRMLVFKRSIGSHRSSARSSHLIERC
ncbi:hypothetical protein SPHINGOAX6_30115 [Sphingomonas sp. AX6]|nr:hypothetical protein SPHINGOAX6_30115 [Sphingomonas sp. AX6]